MPGCPPRFVYIGDFPGPQNAAQPGIDDSVVLQAGEALSAVVNVGEGRAGTLRSSRETLFLGPPRSALRGAGKGVEATLQYLTGLAALLSEPPHRRALERLQAEFSRALVRTLALAAPPPGVVPGVLHLDRSSGLARWPHGSLRRAGDEAAIIRLGHPALVHAGVRDIRGRWVRIYDLFLEPSASVAGTWEAVLPLDADVFTLVHYELAGRGQARWEGIDYRLA
jgi:hypothetical protein